MDIIFIFVEKSKKYTGIKKGIRTIYVEIYICGYKYIEINYERCVFMNLNWDNNLSTGIKSIDDQHKELFNRINKLLMSMKEGKGKDEVIKTLDFLEDYVIKHFNEEEEIQKKNTYPKYNIQHKQHEEFKMELKELRKVFETTGISTIFVINVQQKMSTWWRSHIRDLDKELGRFLIEKAKL